MAVGADYPIATSLLAEFTPRRSRGAMLGGLVTMWFVGAAAAYVIGEILLHSLGDDAWRWMLASAAVPSIILVFLRHGIPESPRWLANKGRVDEAEAVVHKVYGPDASVADLPQAETEDIDLRLLFRSGYLGRMAFVTAFWTCSIVPLFAVYAFGPRILSSLGLEGGLANIGSAFITVLFLAGCLVGVLLLTRIERRPLIVQSFVWSGLALLGLGLFPASSAGVILALFAVYAIFIGGAQALQWVYPNELFPTEVRGSAVGLASSLSRIGAAIGTYLVPIALTAWGIGVTMLAAAAITLIGAAVSLLWAPETRGLSLDEAAAL